jgi:uncharacterized membrane protein YoaK (UPF0700 family)
MTGNTVLLAIGTASGEYARAIRSLLALGGFLTGAFLAGLATRGQDRPGWTRTLYTILLAELALQLAALGWWLRLPDHPSGAARLALIGMLGTTMGAQSGVVARLPVWVSTVYITGTWTAVSTEVARRLRRVPPGEPERHAPLQVAVVGCYLGAAFAAAYLFTYAGPVAAALGPGMVGCVLGVSLWRSRAGAGSRCTARSASR